MLFVLIVLFIIYFLVDYEPNQKYDYTDENNLIKLDKNDSINDNDYSNNEMNENEDSIVSRDKVIIFLYIQNKQNNII
jgi:hypothetical protein